MHNFEYRFNLKINPILCACVPFNGRSVRHFYLSLLSVNCGHHRLEHKLVRLMAPDIHRKIPSYN